jgi:hypothetical protein
LFGHILSTSWAALKGSILGGNIVELRAKPLLVISARRPFYVFLDSSMCWIFWCGPLKSSTYPFFVGCGWSFLSLTFWTLRVSRTWTKTLLVLNRPKILLWVQFYFY